MKDHKIKIYFLVFAFVFSSLSLNVFAATTTTITDIITPIDKNAHYDTTTVRPRTILEYPLTTDMFSWSDTTGTAGEPVTLAQLRQSNITVKYSIPQSQIVKAVTIATMKYNGQTTSCVRVEFAEEFTSVVKREFKLTLYLSMGNSRKDESEITLYGNLENEIIEINSSYDYISLAGGQALTSSEYIPNLEIYLGADVHVFTHIQSGQKYYATAKNAFTNDDDRMLSKYPEIETAIHIKSVNLKPVGNCVSMKNIGTYYVYSGAGKFLGTTAELLPFYDLYYLTSKKITMSTADSAGSATNATENKVGIISGNTPEQTAAQKDMAKAANDAKSDGAAAASIGLKDVEKISSKGLQAMFDAAVLAKMKAKYVVDTTELFSYAVQGRIEINPALAVKLDKDIFLGVYTSSKYVDNIAISFENRYTNKLKVIYLTQEGNYGMTVKISAKLDMTGMDVNKLKLYSYDNKKNSLKLLLSPNTYLDKNGFLHFETIYGGNIIVSNGTLIKR